MPGGGHGAFSSVLRCERRGSGHKRAAVTPGTAAWNLVDGYLRVEYLNNAGAWVAVTQEWLNLGFARGVTAPTAPGTNPVNPNAILLLQQPADR